MKKLFIILLSVLMLMGLTSIPAIADFDVGGYSCPCNFNAWEIDAWASVFEPKWTAETMTYNAEYDTDGTNTFSYMAEVIHTPMAQERVVIVSVEQGMGNGNRCRYSVDTDLDDTFEVDVTITGLTPAECDACRAEIVRTNLYIDNIE